MCIGITQALLCMSDRNVYKTERRNDFEMQERRSYLQVDRGYFGTLADEDVECHGGKIDVFHALQDQLSTMGQVRRE